MRRDRSGESKLTLSSAGFIYILPACMPFRPAVHALYQHKRYADKLYYVSPAPGQRVLHDDWVPKVDPEPDLVDRVR